MNSERFTEMSFKVIEVTESTTSEPRYAAHIAGPGFCLLDAHSCREASRVLKFRENCVFDQKNLRDIIDQQSRKGYSAKIIDKPELFK
jgi:hypothetical protein